MHRRWLAGLSFEHAAHYIVLEDCAAGRRGGDGSRRDHLEAHIEAALPDWSLTPVSEGAASAARGLALGWPQRRI